MATQNPPQADPKPASPWSGAGLMRLLSHTYDEWSSDNAPRLAAALAFYTLLSVAPLLVVIIAVAGIAFGEEAARGQIYYQIAELVGPQGAEAIQSMIAGARNKQTGALASILGLLTLLYGATSVVSELRSAMNQIWDVPAQVAESTTQSIKDLLKDRSYALGLVLGFGFLLIVSLIFSAMVSAANSYLGSLIPIPAVVGQILAFVIPLVVFTGLFALLFRFLPDVRIQWNDVLVGAAATSLLFGIGKLLIGLYLGKTSVASTYGAAGSLVIVLLWVYYSAQILFFGAEFTQVYAREYGSHMKSQRWWRVQKGEQGGAPAKAAAEPASDAAGGGTATAAEAPEPPPSGLTAGAGGVLGTALAITRVVNTLRGRR